MHNPKSTFREGRSPVTRFRQQFAAIRNGLLLLLLLIAQLAAAQSIRDKRVTIRYNYESLSECLKQLQLKSGVSISFNENEVSKYTINDLSFKETPVDEIITKLLLNTNLQFREVNNGLVVFAKTSSIVKEKKDNEVRGRVVDEDNKGIPGVSVEVKGSFKGVYTDNDGRFLIKIPAGRNLVHVSSAGFEAKDVPVVNDTLNIILKKDNKQLESVVVVGYGQVNRKDVTGSVSSLKGDELNKMNASTFDVMMAGRTAGVHVTKTTGAPGAVATIRVRGATSANGSNEPLYVIDGIPMEVGDGYGNEVYNTGTRNKISPLASINSEDIESIDILKDASGTAIYGSRGANGVVLVTTKKGKKGEKPNITFNVNTAADKFVKEYTMLNADQYHKLVTDAYGADKLPLNFNPYPGASTNWANEATRTSVSNDIYLNISGGSPSGNTLYSFSGGLTKNNGAIIGTNFARQNLRASLESTLFEKLRFGTNINFSVNETNGRGTGQYYTLVRYRPDIPIYDGKGNYGASPDSVISNPVARMLQPNKLKNQTILTSFFGELELLKGLVFRSAFSVTSIKGTSEEYVPSTDVFEAYNKRKGSRRDYISNTNTTVFDNTLTYNNRIGMHSINAVLGSSFSSLKSNFVQLESTNFNDDNVLNHLGGADLISIYRSGGTNSGIASYFARANYNYDGKYYLTFTGRTDRSTKFGPNYRTGYFPSGAVAWRISRENFLLGNKVITDLKLRASYGKSGSANFADFIWDVFFGAGNFYGGSNGVSNIEIPNPNIRWETTNQLDIAADFNLFNNKLRGSVGYYRKVTNGMIVLKDIIRETGGREQWDNLGDFLNQGWELQIGSDLVNNKDFAYLVDFNITRQRSKVLKLNGGRYRNLEEGQSMGYFTGYKTAGIFQSQAEIDALNAKAPGGAYQSANTRPGDYKFVDINGDGQITTDDGDAYIGKSEPDFFGGWNNIFRYKNLEVSMFFNFSIGNKVWNSGLKDMMIFTTNNNNYSTDILNAWTPQNTKTWIPRMVQGDPNKNNRTSDLFIEDGTFIKLKNVQVSYQLRNNFLRKLFLTGVRAYASVSNVFVLTGYRGLDPEVNSAGTNNFAQGVDGNTYPLTRTFTIGFTANF